MGGLDTGIITVVAPLLVIAGLGGCVVSLMRQSSSAGSLSTGWEHTKGTVLSATVQVSPNGNLRQEAPLVLYAYQVNGQVFQGHRVRAGDAFGRTRVVGTESSASNTVARYPSGAPVIVYYDPTNPSCSALER